MHEIDEFLINLQTGIADLYHHVRKAEEICSSERANSQDHVVMNDAWLKLENAILNLEALTHKKLGGEQLAGLNANKP